MRLLQLSDKTNGPLTIEAIGELTTFDGGDLTQPNQRKLSNTRVEFGRGPNQTSVIAIRLFLTCMIVYALHFATNTVREIYPALSIGDHLSFDVSEYYGLHPDIFEMPGRGAFINNNPGASILGAIPYFLFSPITNRAVARVQADRESSPKQAAVGYETIYPMAQEFYQKARERGLDIKFGLGAAIMQVGVMAPLSALAVIVMFWIMLRLTNDRKKAILLALLYAFATPVFYRTAQLNQNLLVAHFALFAFALLWRPKRTEDENRRPFYFLAGLCTGWTVVLDYSGLVAVVALSAYAAVRWMSFPRKERSITELGRFAIGVTICAVFLMAYQWTSFGNPFLPAQIYMPPANYTEAGYRGFSLPQFDLLFDTAFSIRFGLFTSAPFLLLVFFLPAWIRQRSRLLQKTELVFVISTVILFFLFCAANQYGRMQFNSGVRHIAPAVPFLFLLAANSFLWLPRMIAVFVALIGTYWMWCLTMYRDVEQGFGILESLRHITLEGFQLPWLCTLEKMGYVQSASPLPLLILAAAAIWLLWNVREQNRFTKD